MNKAEENLNNKNEEEIRRLDYESVEEAGGGSDIGKKIKDSVCKDFQHPNDKQPWGK